MSKGIKFIYCTAWPNTMNSEEYGNFWILVEILAAILKIAAILNFSFVNSDYSHNEHKLYELYGKTD